jgi:3-deoxy-7-phosphoheptulonate synthase
MPTPWTPTSCLQHPNPQAPVYTDIGKFNAVVAKLNQKPSLVQTSDIRALKQVLAQAASGQAFILQGGDCAESFQACHKHLIHAQLNLMHQMADILQRHLKQPVIPLGRIAGQYAKPRSAAFETRGGHTLPSYRGDLINRASFDNKSREPQPALLLKGYDFSEKTLSFIHTAHIKNRPFYTSHEALHLPYEAALTRQSSSGLWYNTSTHLPWLGVRTNQPEGAHVDFLRGIANPIGIKVGPHMTPSHVCRLLECLNPTHETGRILLITRLGAEQVSSLLPSFIQTIQTHQFPVTWSCDPMHGNTKVTPNGIKTRHIEAIWLELEQTYTMHQALGSHLGGIHLEMTAEPVTECLGGTDNIREHDLNKAYTSLLDPRLNPSQALEIATRLAALFKQ